MGGPGHATRSLTRERAPARFTPLRDDGSKRSANRRRGNQLGLPVLRLCPCTCAFSSPILLGMCDICMQDTPCFGALKDALTCFVEHDEEGESGDEEGKDAAEQLLGGEHPCEEVMLRFRDCVVEHPMVDWEASEENSSEEEKEIGSGTDSSSAINNSYSSSSSSTHSSSNKSNSERSSISSSSSSNSVIPNGEIVFEQVEQRS